MIFVRRSFSSLLLAALGVFLPLSQAQGEGAGVLTEYLEAGKAVQAEIVVVVPPAKYNEYLAKIEEQALKDPEWFNEFAKKSKPGKPLPYDEKLGLTKEEYDDYIKLWGKREFEVVEKVAVRLQEGRNGAWKIYVSGRGMPIRLLSYNPEKDTWKSSNGEMARLQDIAAEEESTLGKWTGKEWKGERETPFGKEKENFAIGRLEKGNYGVLIYRYAELEDSSKNPFVQSIVIRFKPVVPEKVKEAEKTE